MSNSRPRSLVLSKVLAPALLLLIWGCGGGSGSSQANLPLGVPPTSETTTSASEDPEEPLSKDPEEPLSKDPEEPLSEDPEEPIEDAVSADLPTSLPPTETEDAETPSTEHSPSTSAETSSSPTSPDPSSTTPEILSISAPSLVVGGEIVIVVAEVSTPAGLQSFQVALTGSGLTVEVPLPVAEVGCTEGGSQCSLRSSLAVPEGITGTYRATLTVTDQLDQSASRSIEFEVL